VRRLLKDIGRDPQTVIVYDNINFKDTVRDEVVGHKSVMRSMTTAAIVICSELPSNGLRQDMHHPEIPLCIDDIFSSTGVSGDDHGLGARISANLIAEAIMRLHEHSVKAVFQGDAEPYPSMPVLDIANVGKTKFWQFGAIYEDEGTIDGTYAVHDNIFLQQLKLRAPEDPAAGLPDDFYPTLKLIYGDQLTTHRIRAVKAEQLQAERPYDLRDWHLGIIAWFHIIMNLGNTLLRTHWGPSEPLQEAHHCLKSDITTWNRSYNNKDSIKFHQLDPLLLQSFTSRVAALFYDAMRSRGCIISLDAVTARDDVGAAIERLTPSQFNELVEDVRVRAFTLSAWEGEGHDDVEFRTMCRLLQEIELFLTIKHAIKHADIGILRHVVDQLIVVFFGAKQSNYGHEMLFLRWNLTDVNDPVLQRSILACGLVNWPGLPNTHKPIDLMLEHLNGSCKIEMKCYKNSTHDVDRTFDRVCLTNTWVRALRELMEGSFGEDMSGKHTSADAGLDIFMLARNLFISDLAAPRDKEVLARYSSGFYTSPDILKDGMQVLASKVEAFNQNHVRSEDIAMAYPSIREDGTSDFADIEEYVNSNEDGVDLDAI